MFNVFLDKSIDSFLSGLAADKIFHCEEENYGFLFRANSRLDDVFYW